MKIESPGPAVSLYIMSDPFIRHCNKTFVEIVDSNESSVHFIRIDSIMHIRFSYTHAFIGTNTLNATISFAFKDVKAVPVFVNRLLDVVAKEPPQPVPVENIFRQIEQDLTQTLSEKFEEFSQELPPKRRNPTFPVAKTSVFSELVIMLVVIALTLLFCKSLSLHYH
jgi:hypothetical protein